MQRIATLIAIISAGALVTGCTGSTDSIEAEADLTQEALELDNGGFDVEDTMPMFGDEADFADLGQDLEDLEITDQMMVHGPDGAPSPEGDDELGVTVLVLWGQLRPNPEIPYARVWNGELETSAGAIAVRRTVRFEGPTDALEERPNHRVVPFRSATRPHNDGLLVTLLPPRPTADGTPPDVEPVFVVRLAGLEEIVVPIADLVDGFRAAIPIDRIGNTIVITTAPAHPCPHGVLAGTWRHLRPDLGVFQGRWMGRHGELNGHVRGVWGVNRLGRQVLFGKYIGNDGRFRGLLRGVWNEGRFTGLFVDGRGEYLGGLAGHYTDLDSGLPGDGAFGGRWVEACDAERCGPDGECPGIDPELPGVGELE